MISGETILILKSCGKVLHKHLIKFMNRIEPTKDKSANECWHWIGLKSKYGYGKMCINSKNLTAHRFMYEMINGDIPSNMFICHKCDNPACVNPNHLFLGNVRDNTVDMVQKNRAPNYKGNNNPRSKITDKIVLEIYNKAKYSGISYNKLAREYKISASLVSEIMRGNLWGHLNLEPYQKYNSKKNSNHRNKLTQEQVIEIYSLKRDKFLEKEQIAKTYGVSGDTIKAIWQGRNQIRIKENNCDN